jgi:hypothetical protein
MKPRRTILCVDDTEKLTKYERAQRVVQRFPVLTQTLPPKWKPWESEHYSTSIFEALAIAAQYPNQVPFRTQLRRVHVSLTHPNQSAP